MNVKFSLQEKKVFFSFVGPVTVVGSPPLELEVEAEEHHKKGYPEQWKAFVAEHPQFMTDAEKKKAAEVEAILARLIGSSLANREAAKSEKPTAAPKAKKKKTLEA